MAQHGLRQLLEQLREWIWPSSHPPRLDPFLDIAGVLDACQRDLDVQFHDQELLRRALTHRSSLQGNGDDVTESNERLEFLGDSVLELIVNEHLYAKFPHKREGDLTKMKSLLVSRSVLARRADKMNLGEYVLLSRAENDAGGRHRASILADAYEAVLGAVYLDCGFEAARGFVRAHLLAQAEAILSDRAHTNYKNMLQEWVQAEFKTYPRYRTSSESGPDHEKLFTVEVMVNGKSFGIGKGSNKKRAEQQAAKSALEAYGKA